MWFDFVPFMCWHLFLPLLGIMKIETWSDCSVYGGALEKDSSNTKLPHRALWLNSGHLLRWVRKTKRDTCSCSLGRARCCLLTLKMLPARKPQQMYFLDFQNYGTKKNLFFIKLPSVWCSIIVMERRLSGATHTHPHLPLKLPLWTNLFKPPPSVLPITSHMLMNG